MSDQAKPSKNSIFANMEVPDSTKLSKAEHDSIILHRQHMAKVNHLELLSTTFRNDLPENIRVAFDVLKEEDIKKSCEASPLTEQIVRKEQKKMAEELIKKFQDFSGKMVEDLKENGFEDEHKLKAISEFMKYDEKK